MGAELGWDEARAAREAADFRGEAVAEGIVVGLAGPSWRAP